MLQGDRRAGQKLRLVAGDRRAEPASVAVARDQKACNSESINTRTELPTEGVSTKTEQLTRTLQETETFVFNGLYSTNSRTKQIYSISKNFKKERSESDRTSVL